MQSNKWLGWLKVVVCFALLMVAMPLFAQTDIAAVTSTISGYVTAAAAVGIAVLLFVLGRRVLRRLI